MNYPRELLLWCSLCSRRYLSTENTERQKHDNIHETVIRDQDESGLEKCVSAMDGLQ